MTKGENILGIVGLLVASGLASDARLVGLSAACSIAAMVWFLAWLWGDE